MLAIINIFNISNILIQNFI